MAEREELAERADAEEASTPADTDPRTRSDRGPAAPASDATLADLDVASAPTSESTEAEDSGSRFSLGLTDRLKARLGSLFSTGSFLVAAALSVVGVFVLGGLLPLGGLGDLVGIAGGAFGFGLFSEDAHYLETGLAGAVVGGTWSLVGNLILTLVGVGAPLIALGFGGGALAGVLGHYFGRDLRDGLTREV